MEAHGSSGAPGLSATAEDGAPGVSSDGVATTTLNVTSSVSFSTAGLATVAKGKTSVSFKPSVGVDTSTKVLVTPQSGGGTFQRVGRNFSAGTITLYLTGKATAAVTLAYFIME